MKVDYIRILRVGDLMFVYVVSVIEVPFSSKNCCFSTNAKEDKFVLMDLRKNHQRGGMFRKKCFFNCFRYLNHSLFCFRMGVNFAGVF